MKTFRVDFDHPDDFDPDTVLDRVGLAEKRRALTHTLSGGPKRRLDVALGVIGRPELLVADEPTGNVDPDMARRLLYLFDSLNKLGTTIIVATGPKRCSAAPAVSSVYGVDKP